MASDTSSTGCKFLYEPLIIKIMVHTCILMGAKAPGTFALNEETIVKVETLLHLHIDVKSMQDQELKQSEPKSSPQNQNWK